MGAKRKRAFTSVNARFVFSGITTPRLSGILLIRRCGHDFLHFQIHSVAPAEADLVALVASRYLHVRVSRNHVELLADRPILRKALVSAARFSVRPRGNPYAEARPLRPS